MKKEMFAGIFYIKIMKKFHVTILQKRKNNI